LLSDIRPHILHCHAPHAALAARAARLLKSVPIVISTQHARDMMDARGRGHWLRQFLTKATQAFGDVVTVPMQNGNANLTDLVIPSGVDLKRFSHNADVRHRTRKALQLGCSFTWLCASRFHPSKDHYTLLRAFAKANQQNPDSLLLLAGDGPGRSEVQELAQALCIADRVRFLGARTDVPALMNAADAYVLASLNETTPAVLLQAAASHLPIVATEVGGVPSIVHHGRTGFAVPPQNPEALASAMQSMMALPEAERRARADSASLYVARYHDMEDVTATWERLYTQLLSRKRVQL
jgi:glycosyltransferase involved in cell wall biosynthesis